MLYKYMFGTFYAKNTTKKRRRCSSYEQKEKYSMNDNNLIWDRSMFGYIVTAKQEFKIFTAA
jgi:hypothetical protein